jgi:phosphotransferase system HPr-like phosphotransfer protein
MKKLITLLLATTLMISSLAACGSSEAVTAEVIEIELTSEEYAFGIDKECLSCYNKYIKNLSNKGDFIMKTTYIRLSTIQDVRNFVEIVCMSDIEIDLSSGRYVVDAKSIMGIFSLDLLNPILLTAHTDDADDLFNKLAPFIVTPEA